MAGFQGAQNAASIYNTLSNYQSSTYGDYIKAQASQPNAFQNFATVAGGVKDLAGAAGSFASMGFVCWVAREVYGIDNPKWIMFREWILTEAPELLRNLYIKYGERIAKFIHNKPIMKLIIRKWMDWKIG
jgi:hypothetical protein